jgi:hypothetical protein
MLKRVYDNFRKGTEKIKWFATLFSERMNIELAIFKLLYQSDEMTRKRQELLVTIGERVVGLKAHGDKNVFLDSAVAGALAEIEKLDGNISELRQKASEISRVTG